MTQRSPTNWATTWLLITGILILFYPPFAMAIGDDITLGNFSCSGGVANGQLSTMSGSCPTTLSFDNVFSFLVCNLQQMATNLLGHMYCGLILNLTPAVWALISLAVIIFGISFTVGLVAATGAEALAFLLKIGFVIAFATQADYIVGYAYAMLISGMTDGVTVVLNGMGVTNAGTGAQSFALLDEFFGNIISYAIGGSGSPDGEARCRNALFAVIATMGIAFPIASYFALALIARILFALFRAVFGYIYAIFGVTFLIILSPIFVSFYLFKPTQSYFNKWLGYLISMVLQVVMLFAFLVFILSLNVQNMVGNITNIIMYQSQSAETTSVRMPWQYCTLCDFRVERPNGPNTIQEANLVCNEYPLNVAPVGGFPPDITQPATNSQGYRPITVTFALSPNESNGQMNALLELLGNGILSLIVLAMMIERLLTIIPSLAQRLGGGLGASYAPQMGGDLDPNGRNVGLSVPGEGLAQRFGQSFKETMMGGLSETRRSLGKTVNVDRGYSSPGNGAVSAMEAIKKSMDQMVTGRSGTGSADSGGSGSSGFSWQRWLSNPNDFGGSNPNDRKK